MSISAKEISNMKNIKAVLALFAGLFIMNLLVTSYKFMVGLPWLTYIVPTTTFGWVAMIATVLVLVIGIIFIMASINNKNKSLEPLKAEVEEVTVPVTVKDAEKNKTVAKVWYRSLSFAWLKSAAVTLVIVSIVLCIVVALYNYFTGPRVSVVKTIPPSTLIGKDAALLIIGDCESNNQQFEADGVTPKRNKEKSTAIGKYQILESVWGKKAEEMDYDLKTEEGNRAMAEYIYDRHGQMTEWEKDPRIKACLAGKLATVKGGNPRFQFIVIAPKKGEKDNWSELVKISPGFSVTYIPQDGGKVNIKFNEMHVQTFDPTKGSCLSPDETTIVNKNQCYAGPTDKLRFQSPRDKPQLILLKFHPYVKI
jgi:hypothetical protein